MVDIINEESNISNFKDIKYEIEYIIETIHYYIQNNKQIIINKH